MRQQDSPYGVQRNAWDGWYMLGLEGWCSTHPTAQTQHGRSHKNWERFETLPALRTIH